MHRAPDPKSLILVALMATIGACILTSQASAAEHTYQPVRALNKQAVFAVEGVDVSAVRKGKMRFRAHGRTRYRRVNGEQIEAAAASGTVLKVTKRRTQRARALHVLTTEGIPQSHRTSLRPTRIPAGGAPSARTTSQARAAPIGCQSVQRRDTWLTAAGGQLVPDGEPSRNFGPGPPIVVGVADTRADYDHPIYFSEPDDPVYTVHCIEYSGRCEIEGMQVRIPAAAKPADGPDSHLAVIDQAAGWEYDLYNVDSKPAGGGTIVVGWGGRTEIGDANALGLDSNATAAHFGLAAGVIRPAELEAGEIDHALAISVKCTNGTSVDPAAPAPGARARRWASRTTTRHRWDSISSST